MENGRTHQMHHDFLTRQELVPFYEDGRKTVEVRVAHARFVKVNPGDTLTFNEDPDLSYRVGRIGEYSTFDEMLEVENPDAIFPGHTAREILTLLHFLYSSKDERKGVIAFELEKDTHTP